MSSLLMLDPREILEKSKKGISWNPPEVVKYFKRQAQTKRMFAKGKREIDRLKRQGK